MSDTSLAQAVLEKHGTTYSDELGIDLGANTPSPLYRWLVAATLFSARISHTIAVDAARALSKAGWRTPQKMAEASWAERTRVLNQSGYARYDESTSRMLGDSAQMLLDDYGGDLRRLREAANGDLADLRKRLKAFKGIGDTGADIFLREVQIAWDEVYPFADTKALQAAQSIGLPDAADALSKLVAKKDFPRLLSGLVRMSLAHDEEDVKKAA